MHRFANWVVRRLAGGRADVRDAVVRYRTGLLEGWVSAAVNVVLAAIKLWLGVVFQSAGLISDAVHSLGDMATSLVVIVSFRASRKPPDAEHPFGHAKAEHVATLIIAILLIVAGFEIGKETVTTLIQAPQAAGGPAMGWGLFLALAGLLAVKELLARFSNALGRIIASEALKADAWHHRTDAITTGIVIVGLAGRNFGMPWLDGVAGIVVAAFIVGTGVQMAYRAVSPLLGEVAGPEELARMREIAQQVAGIESVHDIRVQRYGHFYFTTVHIELSDTINVHRMHEISVQLETRILRHFPGECVVHMDPIDFSHPLFSRVADALRDVVVRHPDLVDFHDLNLWRESGGEQAMVEISVEPHAPADSYDALTRHVAGEIDRHFPGLTIQVLLKVDFSATPIAPG